MDDAEVRAVTKIMMTADHGCGYCAADLLQQFVKLVPEQRAIIDAAWSEKFPAGGWET